MTGKKIVVPVATAVAVLCTSAVLHKAREKVSIPYSDRFIANHAEEWTAYGGSWQLKDGAVVNRSDERGAKVVTGGEDWSDYSVSVEMMMLGAGDIGIVTRVSEPEEGINAYRGYYVGIRTQDQALVMGMANHDWIEARPVPIKGGLHHLSWYRLKVLVVGCEMAAQLENAGTHEQTWGTIHLQPCFRSGKVGLRSLNTGAAYRNVRVERATPGDLARVASLAPPVAADRYPLREADYSRMKLSYYKQPDLLLDSLLGPVGSAGEEKPTNAPALESISSLEMTHRAEAVRIRGVVTLTDPLYVQDGSGGIRVQLSSSDTLNAGDEVELVGKVGEDRAVSFEVSSYQILWEGNLVTPASISSTQAASGLFDGSLVELSGVLRSAQEAKDGTLALEMEDIAQRFTVNVPRGLTSAAPTWWQIGSTVRVRGVCASGAQTSTESAFLVLLRNADDLEYLSSPSWNQGIRLALLIAAGVLLVLLWVAAYLRDARRRMRAVLSERELLAAEMHDTLAQSFAGVGYHLQSIKRGLQLQGSIPENLMRKIDIACSMAVTAHREASERIVSLRHRRQKGGNLLDQLQRSAVSMLSGTHIDIQLRRSGAAVWLSRDTLDVFRAIGEEAIANILRHSQAREMRLSLEFGPHAVEFSVEDDGVGFDVAATPAGLGQRGMELRARQIGATLKIASSPGRGCKVTVLMSYRGLSWLLNRFHKYCVRRGEC
jgi:signal transduction histidine kinase